MIMDWRRITWWLTFAIFSITVFVMLCGCAATQKEYVVIPLDAPPMQDLPVVNRDEFKLVNNQLCITPDAYKRLAVRDKILREQVRVLTAIIQSTQPGQ